MPSRITPGAWLAIRSVAASLIAIVIAGCNASADEPFQFRPPVSSAKPTPDNYTPVVGKIIATPVPARATDGQVHLAYELLLTNVLSQTAHLQSIQVRGDGKPLLELKGDELLPWLQVYGSKGGTRDIGAGQTALVWLDVTVPSTAQVPLELDHVVSLKFDTEVLPMITADMTEVVARTPIGATTPVVVGPPLEGPGWLVGTGCCTVTAHRGAVNPVNGALHIAERYAIDFVQVDANGRYLEGAPTQLAGYKYFGVNVFAVADGPIVSMITDLPEQPPGFDPVGLRLDEYGGNMIVQDIGNGRYAFYAHLMPFNPLGVAVGQVLRRGQVIGRLGNSGNTDSPHLHFHVMDGPSPLGSNGLPFLFDSFGLEGKVRSDASMFAGAQGAVLDIDRSGASNRLEQSPLHRDLMTFPMR